MSEGYVKSPMEHSLLQSVLTDALGVSEGEKNLFIMRGLPGSGKSYWAEQIQIHYGLRDCSIMSADNYFYTSAGEYAFDPTKLDAAHMSCYRAVSKAAHSNLPHVIVDNTNVSRAEFTPYVMLAKAFDYKVYLVHVVCPPALCARRNTHGVPESAIIRMEQRSEPPAPHDPYSVFISNLDHHKAHIF